MFDVRLKRQTNVPSGQHLKVGTVPLDLRDHGDSSARPHCKYNVLNLKSNETAEKFNLFFACSGHLCGLYIGVVLQLSNFGLREFYTFFREFSSYQVPILLFAAC